MACSWFFLDCFPFLLDTMLFERLTDILFLTKDFEQGAGCQESRGPAKASASLLSEQSRPACDFAWISPRKSRAEGLLEPSLGARSAESWAAASELLGKGRRCSGSWESAGLLAWARYTFLRKRWMYGAGLFLPDCGAWAASGSPASFWAKSETLTGAGKKPAPSPQADDCVRASVGLESRDWSIAGESTRGSPAGENQFEFDSCTPRWMRRGSGRDFTRGEAGAEARDRSSSLFAGNSCAESRSGETEDFLYSRRISGGSAASVLRPAEVLFCFFETNLQ